MKKLIVFLLFALCGCNHKTCTPVVITGGGSCDKNPCGQWVCSVAYAIPGPNYSPVPNPSPLMNGLGPQLSGMFPNPHIGDTNFTTCDLNPVCRTVVVPVASPSPSASVLPVAMRGPRPSPSPSALTI